MESLHAMYFDNVAEAVEYCHALVPHIVTRERKVDQRVDRERPVVWFHVPPRCTASTRDGCYLFLTSSALAAARRANLEAVVSGIFPRGALPSRAVLLLGEDAPERPVTRRRRPPPPRLAAPYGDRAAARSNIDRALDTLLES